MAIGDFICLDFNNSSSFVDYVPAGTNVILMTAYGFYNQGFVSMYNQYSVDNTANTTGGLGYLGGAGPNFSATPAPNVKFIYNNTKYVRMYGDFATSFCATQIQ
jgi:hypothetical protein